MRLKNYKYRPLPSKVTISPSKIEGLGLHAREIISVGTNLGISRIYDDRFENGMIRTPLGGFINHSDTPNCKISDDGQLRYLEVIKTIFPTEELTVNYMLNKCNLEK